MASLTLKHVDRAFPNGYEAVKDLNFQIEDGEFVILTGPSGSGKSAVMRMIAGLDEVKNGGKCECPLYLLIVHEKTRRNSVVGESGSGCNI